MLKILKLCQHILSNWHWKGEEEAKNEWIYWSEYLFKQFTAAESINELLKENMQALCITIVQAARGRRWLLVDMAWAALSRFPSTFLYCASILSATFCRCRFLFRVGDITGAKTLRERACGKDRRIIKKKGRLKSVHSWTSFAQTRYPLPPSCLYDYYLKRKKYMKWNVPSETLSRKRRWKDIINCILWRIYRTILIIYINITGQKLCIRLR